MIKPKVNQEPFFWLIKLLFLPIQPIPDSSAHAFSSKGDVSTHIFQNMKVDMHFFQYLNFPSVNFLLLVNNSMEQLNESFPF